MDKTIKQGRLLFAIAIAAIGAENLICAHVSQPVFANNPPAVPVLPFVPTILSLVYFVGMALLAAGVCLAAKIQPRFAALLLGLFFLSWVLVLLVPKAVARPLDLNIRTCVFELLALGASALTFAGCLQEEEHSSTGGGRLVAKLNDKLVASAPYLFAISSIVVGYYTFSCSPIHCQPGTGLDPWRPILGISHGRGIHSCRYQHRDWIQGAGGAFWLGTMFLLWFLLLHAPRVVIHPRDPDEWSSAFIALGMCGGSWICASRSTESRGHPRIKARCGRGSRKGAETTYGESLS